MSELWFVDSARQALNQGFDFIAHTLNQVLSQVAPTVSIKSGYTLGKSSLWEAQQKFRRALPGLRIISELPATDLEVTPWTLGDINGNGEQKELVSVLELDYQTMHLPLRIDFLKNDRRNWSSDHWQRFIADPVMDHMTDWKGYLDCLSNVPNFLGENIVQSKRGSPGRKMSPEKAAFEKQLFDQWRCARDQGVYKGEFAKDNGLTLSEFQAMLNRVAKRIGRARVEHE